MYVYDIRYCNENSVKQALGYKIVLIFDYYIMIASIHYI